MAPKPKAAAPKTASRKRTQRRQRASPAPEKARRSKHQATWLRERLAAEYGPDFNPVLEMARIAQQKEFTPHDLTRFDLLAEYAPYVQPKLRSTMIDLPTGDGKSGELTVRWKS